MNASRFAETIGVQRSSISHIISGRNKPSLDLINKILEGFPKVSTDWLLLGKGDMYIDESNPKPPTSRLEFSPQAKSKKAVRVIVFYDDQTYDEFAP